MQSLPSGITQLFKLGLRLNNPGEFKPSGELYYLEIYDPLELESQWIPIDFINSQLVSTTFSESWSRYNMCLVSISPDGCYTHLAGRPEQFAFHLCTGFACL